MPGLFYIDALPDSGELAVVDGDEGFHAATVRRIRAGEELMLGDGVGGLARCVVGDTPVVFVPWAGRARVGGIDGVKGRPGDGQVVFDNLTGNAAHDVDAELEAFGVDPVGERLESGAVGRGREAANGRNENAVGVPDVLAGLDLVGERVFHVPAFVDD